jgi:aspartyl aminopeptidase
METMVGVPAGNVKTLQSFKKAFEEAGVEFIGSPEDSPGVRLKQVSPKS